MRLLGFAPVQDALIGGNSLIDSVVGTEFCVVVETGDLLTTSHNQNLLWREITDIEPKAWSVGNAASVAGIDGVTTDQRQINYSIDAGDVHVAEINIDPVDFDASAPVN